MPIYSDTNNAVGVTTFQNDLTIIYAPGSAYQYAIVRNLRVEVVNYGTLSQSGSNQYVVVAFEANGSGSFINKPQGTVINKIADTNFAAVIISGTASIVNQGVMLSESHGIAIRDPAANFDTINNSGDIYGAQNGIWVSGANAKTVSIVNSGEISGNANGIHMQFAAGAAPVIFNTGVVSGRTNSIVATDGDRLNVTNNGTLQGHVVATTVNGVDSVTNNGRIVGDVKLGSGADVYKGVGTVSGTIYGEAGADTLTGGSSTDRLNGGADGDKLNGGIGIDYETGGLGNDIFIFNTPLNSANRDVILDFHNASGDNDTFWLDNAYMTKLGAANHVLNPAFFYAGAAAHDANDYIVYNKANGYLYYDSNGNAAGGATLLAVITNKPALAYTDFVVV